MEVRYTITWCDRLSRDGLWQIFFYCDIFLPTLCSTYCQPTMNSGEQNSIELSSPISTKTNLKTGKCNHIFFKTKYIIKKYFPPPLKTLKYNNARHLFVLFRPLNPVTIFNMHFYALYLASKKGRLQIIHWRKMSDLS